MKNNKKISMVISGVFVLILIIGTAVCIRLKKNTAIPSDLATAAATPKVIFNGESLKFGSVRSLVIYNSCVYFYTRSYKNAEHLVGEYIGTTKKIYENDLIYSNYEGLAALENFDIYKVQGYGEGVVCTYDKNNNSVYFYEKALDSESLEGGMGENLFGEKHLDLKNKYDRTKDIKWWYAADEKFDEEKGKKRIAKDVEKIDDIINSLYDARWVKLNKEPSLDDLIFIEFPMKDKTSVEIYIYKDGYIVCPYVCESYVFLKIDKSVVDDIYKMCT